MNTDYTAQLPGYIQSVYYRLVQITFFSGLPKLVIASSGRAGSTMLYNAITASLIKQRYPNVPGRIFKRLRPVLSGMVGRLEDINKAPYLVCKTHDTYQASHINPGIKYIFIHGDPLDSALSVESMTEKYGLSWFHSHQNHLGAEGLYENLYLQDILNYREQLTSWLSNQHRENICCIAYEDIWDKVHQLSEFTGINIILPKKLNRKEKKIPDNVNMQLFSELRKLRDELISV